jgi:hypothetical protein
MSQPFNSPLGNRAYTTDRVSHVQAASCSWWKQRLGELAKRVETSAAEYREAVKQFKDSGVWEDEYDSWEEAAQECLGITDRRANQLVADLVKYISPPSANSLMEPQKPEPVEKTVLEKLGKTGSETVSDSKVEGTPHPPKSTLSPPASADEWEKKEQFAAQSKTGEGEVAGPPKDKTGMVIPQSLLTLFERREEVTKLEHAASLLSAHFERLQAASDPLWSSIKQSGNVHSFFKGASSMRYQIAECVPDVVCPGCQGKGARCEECSGSGVISGLRWSRDWVKSTDKNKLAEVRRRLNA